MWQRKGVLLTQATPIGTSMSAPFRAVEKLDDRARQGSNGFMKALAIEAELELGAAGWLHVLMTTPVASIMVCCMSLSLSPAILECRRECGNEPDAEEFLGRDFKQDRGCHSAARRNCDGTL